MSQTQIKGDETLSGLEKEMILCVDGVSGYLSSYIQRLKIAISCSGNVNGPGQLYDRDFTGDPEKDFNRGTLLTTSLRNLVQEANAQNCGAKKPDHQEIHQRQQIVEILVENGADTTLSDGENSPIDWVKKCRHPEIREWLEQII